MCGRSMQPEPCARELTKSVQLKQARMCILSSRPMHKMVPSHRHSLMLHWRPQTLAGSSTRRRLVGGKGWNLKRGIAFISKNLLIKIQILNFISKNLLIKIRILTFISKNLLIKISLLQFTCSDFSSANFCCYLSKFAFLSANFC